MMGAMMRLWTLVLLQIAFALTNSASNAAGALAIGSTGDVAKYGIAVGTAVGYSSENEANEHALASCRAFQTSSQAVRQCKIVSTFHGECHSEATDPKSGTPGYGWAIASTKQQADERALANCRATAGADRQRFCVLDMKPDEKQCDPAK
jgi:hypothetical protein